MGDAEEDEGPKPNRASIEDEFFRHPHSGAFIRNPFLDKSRSTPILFPEPEFRFNCLEDALQDYHCITVSESSFKEMLKLGAAAAAAKAATDGAPPPGDSGPTSMMARTMPAPASPLLARAALSTLSRLPSSYEFVVCVRKSSYVPPRASRRRQEQKQTAGTLVDKLNIEVVDDGGVGLAIQEVKEGLIAAWSRTHPCFQVRPGDRILKANAIGVPKATPGQMLEEMEQCGDAVRLVVRRAPRERRNSKESSTSQALVAA